MEALNKLTTDFKTAVGCTVTVATPLPLPPTPPPPSIRLTKRVIEDWLEVKDLIKGNDFLKGATVVVDDVAGSFTITNKTDSLKVFTGGVFMVLDDVANEIAVALSGTPTQKMVLTGGRRGKRSARRNRGRKSSRSSKGGRGNRSRRSKGSKGRKSRGRTNKRRNGGAKMGPKMGKELQAWMKRQ
jgi:hypothetical protein